MNTFKRADALLTTSRTLIYGPVASGVTTVVFSGTFANIDSTNKSEHKVNLEIRLSDNTTYVKLFNEIPVEYGGTSKCPKINLAAGESLYGTADSLNSIQSSVQILEIS